VLYNITGARKSQSAWDMNVEAVELMMGIKLEEAVKAGPVKSKEFFANMDQLRQKTRESTKSLNTVSPELITTQAEIERYATFVSNCQNIRNSSVNEEQIDWRQAIIIAWDGISCHR
jgi:hypothetical protein